MGLTQEALAEKANVSPAFIGHIEHATRTPSVLTLFHIAVALDVSLDYLFRDIYSPASETDMNTTINTLEDVLRSLKALAK
jgi:Predicted transcriptional regulators